MSDYMLGGTGLVITIPDEIDKFIADDAREWFLSEFLRKGVQIVGLQAELDQLKKPPEQYKCEMCEQMVDVDDLVSSEDDCDDACFPCVIEYLQRQVKNRDSQLDKRQWVVDELKKRREQIAVLREVFSCQADTDGDCDSDTCPQKHTYLSGCPLFDWDHDEEGDCILPPLPSSTGVRS